jgi:hypothetical protein
MIKKISQESSIAGATGCRLKPLDNFAWHHEFLEIPG